MNIPLTVLPATGGRSSVEYRWDLDTDILTANLCDGTATGSSGTVGVEGSDGSWLIFDVRDGRINGVEVAVWPDVQKLPTLAPPADVPDADVAVPPQTPHPGAPDTDTALVAHADQSERTIHFVLGPARGARTVRIARDVLLDVDERDELAGVWLLNVPPFPTEL